MKILYTANIRLPTEKAHGVQIMKMCEAFAELGHEVTLLVPRRRNVITEDPFQYYGISPLFKIIRRVDTDPIRFGKLSYFIQEIAFAYATAFYARVQKPDVLYSRDASVIALSTMSGVSTIAWEVHTSLSNLFTKIASRNARVIISISNGLAKVLKGWGVPDGKIIVAHDAVDLREFGMTESRETLRERLNLPQKRSIVGYVGKFKTMGSPKGVEEIIEMTGGLSRIQPNIFLLLVGMNDDERSDAEAAAERAGLNKNSYSFVGHVSRMQIPSYLHAADILIMNYPNTPHYAKIMSPLKLFEYMASGVPIVSSDLSSLREVLDNTMALLVPPDDTCALEEGIKKLLRDPALGERLANRALKEATKYSWTARAEKIIEYIGKSS